MIYYWGFYGNKNKDFCVSPATDILMGYVAETISKFSKVTIVSSAKSYNGNKKIDLAINESLNYINFSSSSSTNIFLSKFNTLKCLLNSFFYIVKNIKKDDILIVYHSLTFSKLPLFIQKIKKCKIIYQVCEIYSSFGGNIETEVNYLQKFDYFIFSSELLEKTVNILHKPYTIVYGNYNIKNANVPIINGDKIKLIYAGAFDKAQQGAINAINACSYLDDKYELHILGYGKAEEIDEIKNLISTTNKSSCCQIFYDGLKTGDEYEAFVKSCYVGLNTRNSVDIYNDHTFPSKVIFYLSMGLNVVTSDLKVLTNSKIRDCLTFYKGDNPKSIAEAIKSIDFSKKQDASKLFIFLNEEFTNSIKSLIIDEQNYY